MNNPASLDILASFAQSLVQCGNHQEAGQCADLVLHRVRILWQRLSNSDVHFQDPKCVKAIIAKAESLYNICDFEYSLLLFTRGHFLAPDSSLLQTGVMKCKKTISNKLCQEDIFFVSGAKYFIDYLRREGKGGVDDFLDGKELSFRTVCRLTAVKQKLKKVQTKNVEREKKNGGRPNRLKEDKLFLKSLEKSIKPLSGMARDKVRFVYAKP